MQMSTARAINATWAAPEGTADATTFLQVLDETIVLCMKKNNSSNDGLPLSFFMTHFFIYPITYVAD